MRDADTVQDITERKRAEVAPLESEQRLRLAVQAGRTYAFDWNVATDVIVRSTESVHILNWKDPEHDLGREFQARTHSDDRGCMPQRRLGTLLRTPAMQLRHTLTDKTPALANRLYGSQ